jgi:carbamate kinase
VLKLDGIDAVIDKDRAAEVLAAGIGAAVLLILTNVDGVYRAFGTPQQELLRELRTAAAARMLAEGEFGAGSMGPKVEAAIAFIRNGGQRAIIGRLEQGLSAVLGESGTVIVP